MKKIIAVLIGLSLVAGVSVIVTLIAADPCRPVKRMVKDTLETDRIWELVRGLLNDRVAIAKMVELPRPVDIDRLQSKELAERWKTYAIFDRVVMVDVQGDELDSESLEFSKIEVVRVLPSYRSFIEYSELTITSDGRSLDYGDVRAVCQ